MESEGITERSYIALIRVTCFRCRRRFDLDPVWVGVELHRQQVKDRIPRHFQAYCPACRALNKISVSEMRKDLEAASEAIASALAQQEKDADSSATSPSVTSG